MADMIVKIMYLDSNICDQVMLDVKNGFNTGNTKNGCNVCI